MGDPYLDRLKKPTSKGPSLPIDPNAGQPGSTDPYVARLNGQSVAGPKQKKPVDPEKQLANSLTRLYRLAQSGGLGQPGTTNRSKVETAYRQLSAGVDPAKIGNPGFRAEVLKGAERLSYQNPVEKVASGAGSLAAFALRQVQRPVQAVESAVAESSREGEKHPHGPLRLGFDAGEIATAAKEGFQLKRHDTPLTISREAGIERVKQGLSPKTFTGGDLRSNPLNAPKALRGPANLAFDVGGMAVLDPLTYLTFGLSGAAKAATRTASELLGEEKAAVLAAKGLKGLDEADRATLAERLPQGAYDALKGVKGGVKVRLPTLKPTEEGRYTTPVFPRKLGLGAERTLIPGPVTAARAGKAASELEQGLRVAAEGQRAEEAAQSTNAAGMAPSGEKLRAGVKASSAADAAAVLERRAQSAVVEPGLAAKAGAPLLKAGGRAANTTVGRTLGDVFKPRAAIARTYGPEAAAKVDEARAAYRGRHQSAVEDDLTMLSHAVKSANVSDEDAKLIGRALDVGGEHVQIPDHLQPVLEATRTVRDRVTQAQLDAGLLTPETMHPNESYFPHVATPEGRKYLTGRDEEAARLGVSGVPGRPSVAGINDPFRRGRKLEGSAADINTRYEQRVGGPMFEENAVKALASRSMKARQAVAAREFADRMVSLTGKAGDELARKLETLPKNPAGVHVLPAGWEAVKVGDAHYAMPHAVAVEARKVAPLAFSDEGMRNFVHLLDAWQGLWKGYATVPFVFGAGFHERNAVGNVFNNLLAGVKGVGPYRDAQRIQHLAAKGKRQGDALKFLSGKDRDLFEQARRHDVIGEGFYGVDVPADVAKSGTPFRALPKGDKLRRVGQRVNPLSQQNAVIASGRRVGSGIEQNARLAHFIAKADQTGSYSEAARSVRKYLFDYSDLSATEQAAFKRIVPFYTFTRKNIPVQLEGLLKTPGKYSHYQEARLGVADQAQPLTGMESNYLPGMGGTPLPQGLVKFFSHIPGLNFDPNTPVEAAPDLPLLNASNTLSPIAALAKGLPGVGKLVPGGHEDQGQAVSDLLAQIGGGLPGLLSSAGQVALGKQFFAGLPLQGRRQEAPVYALPFAQKRMLNGKKQPTVTDKSQFFAEANLPILSKIAGFFPRGEYQQDKAPRRRLSASTGLRVYPQGAGTRRSEQNRRLDLLAQLIKDLQNAGYTVPSAKGR